MHCHVRYADIRHRPAAARDAAPALSQVPSPYDRAVCGPGPCGFEHWTLRCAKCGTIQAAQVDADPMQSDALRWIGSRELLPPQ